MADKGKKYITIEVCCGSAQDVIDAAECGADRVELNAALELGGLTPSPAALKLALAGQIPIIAMLRPRGGGFFYREDEFESMLVDARWLLDNGADGLAFGILTREGLLDEERCKQVMDIICKSGGKEAVFHRAFDEARQDEAEMLGRLRGLGINRLLTSGRAKTVPEGLSALARYNALANEGKAPAILPGGGVRPNNAHETLERTGVTQLHGSFHHDGGDGNRVIDRDGLRAYIKTFR